MFKRWLLLLTVVGVMVGIGYVWKYKSIASIKDIVTFKDELRNTVSDPLSSPLPFADLTIPHLRTLTYDGKLGERVEYQKNENYTSYLTSYSSQNLKINGLLTIPAGNVPEGGWPAIVFIHGYIPPTLYESTQRYISYIDYLARNGFVVFKIDLRGHGDSEGEASGAYYSGDYVIDTLNAYAALATSQFVHPERIGLWGHSMSGNIVLRSMVVKPEIKAAVIWAGAVYSYTDWQKYQIDDNSYRPPEMSAQRQRRRQELFATHGEFSEQSPFWMQVAPTNYLNDLKGVIQLHHALDDTVVNIGYSRDVMELLKRHNSNNELYEYSTGGHDIEGASFTAAMERTVEFYKKNLK